MSEPRSLSVPAKMIPSAAIACLYWLKAERPQDYRAWWRILARTWR